MRSTIGMLTIAAVAVTACSEPQSNRTVLSGETVADTAAPQTALSPEAKAELELGNAAYRAEDYETAVAHYRKAADLSPHAGAAWYGVAMAETALGNTEAAAAAGKQAESFMPGISGGHGGTVQMPGMPAGHPPTGADSPEGDALPPGHPAPSSGRSEEGESRP